MEQAQRSLQLADDFCSGMLPQIYPWYIEDYRRLSSQSLTGNIRVVKGFSNRPRIGFWHCSVLSWCHPILSLLKSWCLLDLNHIFSSVKLMKLVKCTSFEYLHHWKNPCLSSLNYITYSPHFWYWSCQVSCWGNSHSRFPWAQQIVAGSNLNIGPAGRQTITGHSCLKGCSFIFFLGGNDGDFCCPGPFIDDLHIATVIFQFAMLVYKMVTSRSFCTILGIFFNKDEDFTRDVAQIMFFFPQLTWCYQNKWRFHQRRNWANFHHQGDFLIRNVIETDQIGDYHQQTWRHTPTKMGIFHLPQMGFS